MALTVAHTETEDLQFLQHADLNQLVLEMSHRLNVLRSHMDRDSMASAERCWGALLDRWGL